MTLEKWGWGLSRKGVMRLVADNVNQKKIRTPFKGRMPGQDWFMAFAKRHNLSIKKPQSVKFARKKCMDPFIINKYFRLLNKTWEYLDLFDKPHQIWNLDETGFYLDPSKTKMVNKRGPPCSRTTGGVGRNNITVLMAANAAGFKAPSLIIFKGKNIWDEWGGGGPEGDAYPGTTYSATSNG